MIDFSKLRYVYSVKTTDAELRGVREISSERFVSDGSLPVFELTRSRATKKLANGDVDKRMEQIREICAGRPFVLDLTSHDDLSNPQIERLHDDANGFKNWRDFLSRYNDLDIIPAIHTYVEDFEQSLREEVGALSISHGKMAFRLDAEVDPLPFLRVISDQLGGLERVLLIVDAEYVDEKNFQAKSMSIVRRLQDIAESDLGFLHVVVMSSSFPSSVTSREGGGDDFGALVQYEKRLFEEAVMPSGRLIYGDYASIHPVRYQTRGGAWVPRIDISHDEYYIYTRYRREDGGYVRAAQEMVALDEYDVPNCWAADQIDAAAAGSPNGRSPSFWISARLNGHVSRVIDSFLR